MQSCNSCKTLPSLATCRDQQEHAHAQVIRRAPEHRQANRVSPRTAGVLRMCMAAHWRAAAAAGSSGGNAPRLNRLSARCCARSASFAAAASRRGSTQMPSCSSGGAPAPPCVFAQCALRMHA